MPQTGSPLHEALQKGRDRHQAEATGDDQTGQHHLPSKGQVFADIDHRESRHGDRRCGRKQRLPEADVAGRAQRRREEQGCQNDDKQTRHHGELRDRELVTPTLQRPNWIARRRVHPANRR